MIQLRDYQKECLDIIDNLENGAYLIRLATGLGKTIVFTNMKRKGKTLILAHREELVRQPIKYFDCKVGVEMSSESSDGEEVIIASVQTLHKRLSKFNPEYFDTIITDECHHSPCKTYREIYNYFNFRLHLGFTATPCRNDNVRLDDIYSDIIYDKDIKWAIQNKYLCNIKCLRVNIGYDLSSVTKRMGDFATGELEKTMNTDALNKAIGEAYREYAKGQTLIFATSVEHAQDIAKQIKGAVAVTADTRNRSEIIERFTRREIPVLVNCMIFTEGTDMPLIETIMIARPTQNASLYTQMVGRGLRLHPDKEKLTLIDLVGTTGKNNICTAPTLIGIDLEAVPKKQQDEIEGDLFDLPELILKKSDCIESWIRNVEIVNLWAKEQDYRTHNINFFKMPDGSFIVQLPEGHKIIIAPQDELGKTSIKRMINNASFSVFPKGTKVDMQKAFDEVYSILNDEFKEQEYIWNLAKAKNSWGKQPASPKQLQNIRRMYKGGFDEGISKFEASQILNRLFYSKVG